MSLCLNSLVIRRLAKLPVGVPVSVPIGGVLTPTTNVRFATKMSRAEVKAIRERARQAAKGTVIPKGTHPFPPGHGDRVYVFHHFLDGITVYSNTPVLKVCPLIYLHIHISLYPYTSRCIICMLYIC